MAPKCTAFNGAGASYEEFSCVYPTLGKTYLGFERYYDTVPVLNWMQHHNEVPILACIIYVVGILYGRYLMKSSKPWNLRNSLALWNLSLSLFSFMGAFRTAPQLYHNLTTMALRDVLCLDPQTTYGSGSTGLWVQLFILSKIPELWDTFFIVIHKKPLIFLHWYHHITVLLYCWHSYVTTSPSGLFFVVMNYSVHAIMYGYYFLMAVKCKPKWLNAMFITTAQISQMIVGVMVTIIAFYYYSTEGPKCMIQRENNIAAFIMYGSYLLLFAQFFVARYFSKGKSQKEE